MISREFFVLFVAYFESIAYDVKSINKSEVKRRTMKIEGEDE